MFSSKPKFDGNKAKVNLKMLLNRFDLLKQKKTNLNKQEKRKVALLLKDDKEANARILVEHIIREDYTLESYELLRQYAELLLARLNIVMTEAELKPEIAESVCSLLYAGYLMGSEVPELQQLYILFTAKYGMPYSQEVINNKEKYLNARLLRILTSTQVPDQTVVELYLGTIAKAYNVAWAPRPQPLNPQALSSTLGVALPMPGQPVAPEQPPELPPAMPAMPQMPAALPTMPVAAGAVVSGPSITPVPLVGPAAVAGEPALGGDMSVPMPFSVQLVKSPQGFGMHLDAENIITAIKDGSQSAHCGQLAVGDKVLSLNGIGVSRDHPVKSVAIDIPEGGPALFQLLRTNGPPPMVAPAPTVGPPGGMMPQVTAMPVMPEMPVTGVPMVSPEPQPQYGVPYAMGGQPAPSAGAAPMGAPLPVKDDDEDDELAKRLAALKR